ncbi:RHS repeat-associated core domain-containing protein [Shewanella sp. AC91-MNA-CIBAN-0169]|uniref:RHS repeat domain-containing protein n=1 Tax=Shewanella sp. AC91-MNA-CIBAN-0169 TaxID=3140466 RepID=UPI00332EA887
MRYWLTHLLLIEGRVNGSAGLECAEHIQQPASSALSSDTARPNKNLNDVVVNNDRLMSMAGVDYRYDVSGNQISQIGSGDKQQRSFNGLNQLVQINVNGKLTQYEYDALGRRSAKITELGRTDFIWDNHQLIGECTLGEYTWYIYQPDTFTPVALIKSGQVYYYHLDQLGTPICLTDENTQIVWRSQQDVFGQTIKSTSIKDTDIEDADNEHADIDYAALQDKIPNPIRFQGQYFDDESGLHYNRFRYYSPGQARFIHQDPIGLVGGINHYQYAPNPVNWVDPFGLMCKEGEASLNKALNCAVDTGSISKQLQLDLLEAAQIGFLTPKEIKQGLASGNVASLFELSPSVVATEHAAAQNESIDDQYEAPTVDELIDTELDKITSLIFKEGEEFKKHVLMNYYLDPDMQVLTREEFLAISVYSTDLCEPINKGLRGFSPEDKAKWSTLVAEADNGLVKLAENPKLRFEGQVFRGDKFTDELIEELFPVGGIHHEKAFKSSTSDVAKVFDGNTIIYIKSKTGVNISDNAAV